MYKPGSGRASRSGRDESEIRLLGVTKSAADGEVRELIEAGLLLLGENRCRMPGRESRRFLRQSGISLALCRPIKSAIVSLLPSFILWIGGLWRRSSTPRRSAGETPGCSDSGQCLRRGKQEGPVPSEVLAFARRVLGSARISTLEAMTMAHLVVAEAARPHFREARLMYEQLQQDLKVQWDTLSMGMTNDFEVAVEEGATLVRIGSALFAKEES